MKEYILICDGLNINRATLAAMLMEAAGAIALVETPVPQPDLVEMMQAITNSCSKVLCVYYYERDYYAEARQGIADQRAWLARRVSLVLKTVRRFSVTARRNVIQYAWSARRWKSLT